MTPTPLTMLVLILASGGWSVFLVALGISIGWRCRGGLSPFPSVSNPFKSPPPAPELKKPKPQESV